MRNGLSSGIGLKEIGKSRRDRCSSVLRSGLRGVGLSVLRLRCELRLAMEPMRVEQRIGRIDRKGQRSEKVLIYNLVTPDTVDADIYERCLLRIGIFNSALGASEEILGEIAQEIHSVANDIELSACERQEKLQQIADNKIRLIQEQQALEDKQAELFGIRLPGDQTQKEIEGGFQLLAFTSCDTESS